jgi:hypothetical protein
MIAFLPIGNQYKSSCLCTQGRHAFSIEKEKLYQKRPEVAFVVFR